MTRQIFKKCVIAIAGPLPGQYTMQNLKRWIEQRKGRFADNFDETVTHLLCTHEQYNAKVPRVKEALALGKRFNLVHFDWFECSCFYNHKEREAGFLMNTILAKENAERREKARIEKGTQNGKKFVNTNMFHIYRDREGFPYQIQLTRETKDDEDKAVCERYTLSLWESNAKPPLFWFTAKYMPKQGHSNPHYYKPSEYSGKWRREFTHFTDFFKKKTKIDWEDRVVKEMTEPKAFQYNPPTRGKPVGRRLRFSYDICRQLNAEIRGLPPPNEQESAAPIVANSSAESQQPTSSDEVESDEMDLDDGPDADMMLYQISDDTSEVQERGASDEMMLSPPPSPLINTAPMLWDSPEWLDAALENDNAAGLSDVSGLGVIPESASVDTFGTGLAMVHTPDSMPDA